MNRKRKENECRIEKEKDTYTFDPYNDANVEITAEDVKAILKEYNVDVPITNFNLYRRAFIHRSYVKYQKRDTFDSTVMAIKPANCLSLSTKSNERLEFIGDGVLECITKYYLYRRFPKENEGFMTEKKIALVKNEAIGRIAHEMGLHKWFVISKQAEEKQIRHNLKKLGCLFESLLGAIFLDFNKKIVKDSDDLFRDLFVTGPGFQIAQTFIEAIFEKHVNWTELIQTDDNYKNILQVKIQREFKITPDYLEMLPHNPIVGYNMGVYLCVGQMIYNLHPSEALSIHRFASFREIHEYVAAHGKIFLFLGQGTHKIKKKAEQIASLSFGANASFP